MVETLAAMRQPQEKESDQSPLQKEASVKTLEHEETKEDDTEHFYNKDFVNQCTSSSINLTSRQIKELSRGRRVYTGLDQSAKAQRDSMNEIFTLLVGLCERLACPARTGL